ncbi:hypothetical protein CBR_g40358 [Chara braunii]|uniref:histidinol-phosphate transaminase n=1 Tax=Chara braunii TaxID=69332 RepID=A0A388LTJ2_CHABU|nr:hypothetical protein CBR_g40358 [Chara braunii]|eukprot:GBG85630.1 hypothetical protein CBR_g40358 [Chara braunii]
MAATAISGACLGNTEASSCSIAAMPVISMRSTAVTRAASTGPERQLFVASSRFCSRTAVAREGGFSAAPACPPGTPRKARSLACYLRTKEAMADWTAAAAIQLTDPVCHRAKVMAMAAGPAVPAGETTAIVPDIPVRSGGGASAEAADAEAASQFIRPHLRKLAPYTPIEPFEILSARLGFDVTEIVKLDANENLYGPPPEVLQALGSMDFPNIYPDPESRRLRAALSKDIGIEMEYLLAGCGADELIDLIMRCTLDPGDKIVDCPPTFTMYAFDAAVNGVEVVQDDVSDCRSQGDALGQQPQRRRRQRMQKKRREKVFGEEKVLLTMAAEWRTEAEGGAFSYSGLKISLLLSHLTDLLATCIAQQEDIHSLENEIEQVSSCLKQLEQRPVATLVASSSKTADRLDALEINVGTLTDGARAQQAATQQLEQRICTAAAGPSTSTCETIPKFDGQEIFSDSMKTDPIPWFRQFELKLELHHTSEDKKHAYLHSQSGGTCQAWLDNLLSTHEVVASELHTKISWADLKAAWHKWFQIEPSEHLAEQRLDCRVPMLGVNARRTDGLYGHQTLLHFEVVSDIIQRIDSSRGDSHYNCGALLQGRTDNRHGHGGQEPSSFACVRPEQRTTSVESGRGRGSNTIDPSSEAASANEGDRLAAARDGGRHSKDRGRGKSTTNTMSNPGPGAAAQDPWTHCGLPENLNAQTVKNVEPLPRIDNLLERLGGAKYLSKLDLKSGYHQISIRPNDRYKSAFKTRYGHFEWVVMPFGLTNALATFQATMTNEFRAMLDRFVPVYLDDILVYSRTLEDHLEHLRRVLETLRRTKYKANRDKCEFVRQELEYLGHFVTPEGISPLSDKIQAIQEWSEPRNVTDVRSFLGLAGYYQRFIKGYSKIAAHLTKLQCKDRPSDVSEDARGSFLALKAALLSAEVLCIYDPLLPTRVPPDALGYGIGVILEQYDGVDGHPVEYFSKKVPVVHSIDNARKEFQASVHALKRWQHFFLGRSQSQWVTDNNPLVFYKTQDTINSTIARWMAFIASLTSFLITSRGSQTILRMLFHGVRIIALPSIRPSRSMTTWGTPSSEATKPIPSFATSARIAPLLIRRHRTTGSKRGTCLSTRGGRTFSFQVTLTSIGGFLASSTTLPPPDTLESIERLADFASDFGGPAFSATSHTIASHARFVDAANPVIIAHMASCDHYRSPCAEGKRLPWTSPGRSLSTRPVWMGFSMGSTDSPSSPCFCLVAIMPRHQSWPRLPGFQIDVEGIKTAVKEHEPKAIFLTSPNNPDGSVLGDDDLLEILELPVLVILDEAYIEFAKIETRMLPGFQIDVEGIKTAVKEHEPKAIFLTSPNNPDGSVLGDDDLLEILELPVLVILDEAYIEFAKIETRMSWVKQFPNLIVLRTFSKRAECEKCLG